MSVRTVAIQSPGDMGHGVARELRERGFAVVTALDGRSTRTRTLAGAAGVRDVGSLEALVQAADLVLSILPPSAAEDLAGGLASAMRATGARPVIADCNAIAPATATRIAALIAPTGAVFIDAGIIGLAPGRSELPTRIYCSGPDPSALLDLDGGAIRVRSLGAEIGRASALKMIYAAVTKGTMTLHAAALIAAEAHGLSGPYHAELRESQPQVWAAMNRMVPRLPLDAGRWIGEMHEIAATFRAAGLPSGFHEAAADVFSVLERTPIAAETRESADPSRTLDDVLAMYVEALAGPGGR